jgi:hypothetical protein
MDHWKSLDPWGWSNIGLDSQPLVIVPDALELARVTYQQELQNFHMAPMQDRALRDLLSLCRQERIPTVLYLMPEGSIYRSWYAPATRTCLDAYLTGISRELGVPIVNARTWMPDKYFGDSHHLYRRGAILFTQRFGADVLSCLVQGKLESIPSLLVPLSPAYPREEQEPEMQVRKPSSPSSPILSIDGGKTPSSR